VEEIFMDLFGFSRPTYYKWKRENIKVIQLLEKYFSKDELEEFLETGSIRKLETEKFKNFVDPLFIEYVKFNLPSKMDKIKGEGLIMRLNRLIPNHILTTILKEIKEDEDIELHQDKSKKFLIDRIKGYAASFEKKSSQKQLIDLIDKNFSNIECYVLIKYYDEILDKG
jgi:hypothetical protein